MKPNSSIVHIVYKCTSVWLTELWLICHTFCYWQFNCQNVVYTYLNCKRLVVCGYNTIIIIPKRIRECERCRAKVHLTYKATQTVIGKWCFFLNWRSETHSCLVWSFIFFTLKILACNLCCEQIIPICVFAEFLTFV